MEKSKIFKNLLSDNNVNNYTKVYILLSRFSYYKDNYIPNKKISNILKINKIDVIRAIAKLKQNNIIKVFYKGKKRYFKFINLDEEYKQYDISEFDNYNWYEDL